VTFWHSAEYGSDFRLNSGEITSEVKKFRGIPCWRNFVDTLALGESYGPLIIYSKFFLKSFRIRVHLWIRPKKPVLRIRFTLMGIRIQLITFLRIRMLDRDAAPLHVTTDLQILSGSILRLHGPILNVTALQGPFLERPWPSEAPF
jgi:hypothetical protein